MRLPDTPLKVAFPCRPTSHVRKVPLTGQTVTMTLHACDAAGQTFAIAWVDTGDPARTGVVLQALGAAAGSNLAAAPASASAFGFPGMTPHPAAATWRLLGRRPDGEAVHAQVAVFAVGTQAFQATVLGAADEPARPFFAAIEARP